MCGSLFLPRVRPHAYACRKMGVARSACMGTKTTPQNAVKCVLRDTCFIRLQYLLHQYRLHPHHKSFIRTAMMPASTEQSTSGIHSGASTHHQLHDMTLQSFRTMNAIRRISQSPTLYPAALFALLLLFIVRHPLSQSRICRALCRQRHLPR